MNRRAIGTLPRDQKGPVAPAPKLDGVLGTVVDTVSSWPGVETTVHWHLCDHTRVDGADFYLGDDELGHLHLDGVIHLASDPGLGSALVSEGAAKPFRHVRGWVEAEARRIGADAAVALFRRNYDQLQVGAASPDAMDSQSAKDAP